MNTLTASKYILDAHTLIWYMEGNPKMGNQAKNIIDAVDSQLVLPLIALIEASLVIALAVRRVLVKQWAI